MTKSNRFSKPVTLEQFCRWASQAPACGECQVWLTDTETPEGWRVREDSTGRWYIVPYTQTTVYIDKNGGPVDGETGAIYNARFWVDGRYTLVRSDEDFVWRKKA